VEVAGIEATRNRPLTCNNAQNTPRPYWFRRPSDAFGCARCGPGPYAPDLSQGRCRDRGQAVVRPWSSCRGRAATPTTRPGWLPPSRQPSRPGWDGRRKLTAYLRRTSLPDVSRTAVVAGMRVLDHHGIRRVKSHRTTIPAKDGTRAGDRLNRDFAGAVQPWPTQNEKLAAGTGGGVQQHAACGSWDRAAGRKCCTDENAAAASAGDRRRHGRSEDCP